MSEIAVFPTAERFSSRAVQGTTNARSGRGQPLPGTRETWVARFVVGYAKVNRCRTQSPALPCTL